MLPVFSAAGILICGGIVLLRSFLGRADTIALRIDPVFVVLCAAILAVSLAAMTVTGPALVHLWTGGTQPYRAFIDTPGIKHAGFLLGGGLLTGGLTALATGRMRGRHWAVAFGAALVLALLYDLPFDTLLLPPNGDV
jgi:hypothetical protein